MRTQAEIRDTMKQNLFDDNASLVGNWLLNEGLGALGFLAFRAIITFCSPCSYSTFYIFMFFQELRSLCSVWFRNLPCFATDNPSVIVLTTLTFTCCPFYYHCIFLTGATVLDSTTNNVSSIFTGSSWVDSARPCEAVSEDRLTVDIPFLAAELHMSSTACIGSEIWMDTMLPVKKSRTRLFRVWFADTVLAGLLSYCCKRSVRSKDSSCREREMQGI